MIALGRALVARGHEVTLQTVAALARATSRRRAWRSRRRPSTRSSRTGPEPLDFYEAVVHAARDTQPLVRELRPTSWSPTSSRSRRRWRPSSSGVPLRDADPPRPSRTARRGFPIYSLGARLPRSALGRRALARALSGRVAARARARPRASSTRTRARLGLPPRPRPRRHQPRARARRDVPAARVPARAGRRTCTSSARCMWEPPDGRRRARRRATSRSCWSRRRRRRTRSTGCCARRCAGSPTRRCACSRPGTGACPRAAAGPRQRARRRLGVLRAHDAALRRRRLPRRPRHARPRAVVRLRRRRLPRRRRHERERGAPRLGGRGRAHPPPLLSPRALVRLAVERALRPTRRAGPALGQ